MEMFHRKKHEFWGSNQLNIGNVWMLSLFTEATALQEVLQEIHRLQWGMLVEK